MCQKCFSHFTNRRTGTTHPSSWWLNSLLQPDTFTSELQFTVSSTTGTKSCLKESWLSNNIIWCQGVMFPLYYRFQKTMTLLWWVVSPENTWAALWEAWSYTGNRAQVGRAFCKVGEEKICHPSLTWQLKTGFHGKWRDKVMWIITQKIKQTIR